MVQYDYVPALFSAQTQHHLNTQFSTHEVLSFHSRCYSYDSLLGLYTVKYSGFVFMFWRNMLPSSLWWQFGSGGCKSDWEEEVDWLYRKRK